MHSGQIPFCILEDMISAFLKKNKQVFLYGCSLAGLLFLLKWLELRFIIINHSFEIYIGAIALVFTVLGIWLAQKLIKPRIQVVEKEIYIKPPSDFTANDTAITKFNLSKREIEVLMLIAEGCSNQEIAEKLFISLNTVKTHTSRLFEKLDVKRRTQAIEKAQREGLIT